MSNKTFVVSFVVVFLASFVISASSVISCSVTHEHKNGRQIVAAVNFQPPVNIEPIPLTREERTTQFISAMRAHQRDRLPFDEPLHEWGLQLDGRMRPVWLGAYQKRKLKYSVTNDFYPTFGRHGVPLVPQVCADFIIDTIDRAAGTWYAPNGAKPGRKTGNVDLRSDIEKMSLEPRRVSDLIEFFRLHPKDFAFLHDGDGPEMGNSIALNAFFLSISADVGDIVIVKGEVPWDKTGTHHFHSFFITRIFHKGSVDLVTGNPSRPIEWSIKREIARAPLRHVIAVVMMTDEFMGRVVGG